MKYFSIYIALLGILITNPVSANQETIYVSNPSNALSIEKFCDKVSNEEKTDAYQSAVFCPSTIRGGQTVKSIMLEKSYFQGLRGLCSLSSNKDRVVAGHPKANPETCNEVLSAAEKLAAHSAQKIMDNVFKIYETELANPQVTTEWRDGVNTGISIVASGRWSDEGTWIAKNYQLPWEAQVAYVTAYGDMFASRLAKHQKDLAPEVCESAIKHAHRRPVSIADQMARRSFGKDYYVPDACKGGLENAVASAPSS